MNKDILLILIGNRRESAVTVQRILTEKGCFIKTRLGIHDGAPDACTNTGLVILELVGKRADHEDVAASLNAVPGVKANLVHLSLDE